jgi:hypothetical protein
MGSGVCRVKRECVPGDEPQIEWRAKMMFRIAFSLPPPGFNRWIAGQFGSTLPSIQEIPQ